MHMHRRAVSLSPWKLSTYECSQFRREFAADSSLEGAGFEREIGFVSRALSLVGRLVVRRIEGADQ
jgi:hypothetical protein